MSVNVIENNLKIIALKKLFSTDIEAFGKFFFPHYAKNDTPKFHREVYDLYEDDNLNKIVTAAPRGHAKSTITDLIYLAWVVINKKANFVLLISDKQVLNS